MPSCKNPRSGVLSEKLLMDNAMLGIISTDLLKGGANV
jgi:hypothetical protein